MVKSVMKKNTPIRHHYIPQFILRNFSVNKDNRVLYYNKKHRMFLTKGTENVFMSENLYQDYINNPDNPVQIEENLSRIENEAARIIRRMVSDSEIELSLAEEDCLSIFLALMSFRSKRAWEFFSNIENESSRVMYSYYQEDEDFEDLWKRNLGEIVKCNTLDELFENKKIDEPIRLFMKRDTIGLTGMYFMVVEKRGDEDFLIGDCYPIVVEGMITEEFGLPLYQIFPISPNRCLLLVSDGIENARIAVTGFDKKFFRKPTLDIRSKALKIHIKNIYENDVKKFNQMIYKHSNEGVIFQNRDSLKNYI